MCVRTQDGSLLQGMGKSVFEHVLGPACGGPPHVSGSGFTRTLTFTQPKRPPATVDAHCVQRQQFAVFAGAGRHVHHYQNRYRHSFNQINITSCHASCHVHRLCSACQTEDRHALLCHAVYGPVGLTDLIRSDFMPPHLPALGLLTGEQLVMCSAMSMRNIPFKDSFTVNSCWEVKPVPGAPRACTLTIGLKVGLCWYSDIAVECHIFLCTSGWGGLQAWVEPGT